MPKISVILPFYNAEKTLARAIESVLVQNVNFELILVNNASTDGSGTIAKSYLTNPRVRYFTEAKQGVVFASAKGLAYAESEFIARFDADDEMPPERLTKQLNFLKQNPKIGMVSGRVNYVPHRNNTKGFAQYVAWVNSINTTDQILANRFVESPLVNPSVVFRKVIADQHGWYNHGDFPEDYELYLRWMSRGVLPAKIADTVLNWYDSDTRLTRTDNRYSSDAFYRIKTQYAYGWLGANNPYFPKIVVWGAGKLSRRRLAMLEALGIKNELFIDVKVGNIDGKPVLHYSKTPKPGKYFIVSYVGNRGMGAEIRKFLIQKGYTEGENFILMA